MNIRGPWFPWSVTVGVLLYALLADVLAPVREWAYSTVDDLFPVVVMKDAKVVYRTDRGEIVFKVKGYKWRECEFIAPPDAVDDMGRDLGLQRLDKPANGKTRGVGPIAEQTWLISEIEPDAQVATVHLNYRCDGRATRSLFAQIQLKEKP